MGWLVAATCTILLRATWIRRWSLFNVSDRVKIRERTLTLALLLQAGALFLMTPASDNSIGWALHQVTGIRHLDTWAGDCLYMGACGLIGVNVSSRLPISDRRVLDGFRTRFALPMVAIANIMLALLAASPNARFNCPDMFRCTTDIWLDLYWTVFCSFLIWVMSNTLFAAVLLRRKPHNRRAATLYIAALSFAITCAALRIVTTWTDDSPDKWFWITDCVAGAVLAHVASWAWQQRIRRMSRQL